MFFLNTIGPLELTFIGAFFIFYILYVFRMIIISKKIKTSLPALLIKLVLRTSYFVLLIFALLGPYLKNSAEKVELKSISKDIYIALDLSLSMNAEDVPPTRLERTKFEFNKILKAFTGDKLGIIIFSSYAYIQCPLTFDQTSLALFLDVTNTDLISSTGTNFAKPLQLALDKHQKNKESKKSSKIIILVSDGEDFGEETKKVVEEVKDAGIKLFTVGVGTKKGIELKDKNNRTKTFEGQKVISKLNDKPLRELAKLTRGSYFEISDQRNDTEKLINAINKIKGEVRDSKQTTDPKSLRYFYFIAIALLLMALDYLISIRVIHI